MSKCPTINCGETLPVHSRRKYCSKCRHSMARYDSRTTAEVLKSSRRFERGLFRITHMAERKLDQQEALTQLRKSKRKFSKSVRSNGERARI